ncbi:MAG: alpha/beta hydrolase, partial [Dehalococcoidia bacterium]|nr:alpha/beta hydrolase [Dehalococcoidia bacterium]
MVTATSYQEKTASVGSLTLNYQEWGESTGPAVLMLHGFGVSGHMFDEFAERAAGKFRLIALDQRGHGDSDWSEDGDYSREAFVSDVEGFRQALGLDSFILVGHSMGGLNAVAYTAQHPSRVRALVLVDVGPESAREGVENIVRFTRGPDMLEFDEFVEMAHRFNPRRSLENIRDRMRHRLKEAENGKWTWKFD